MTSATRASNLATEALTKALITLVSAGTRPRCGDPDTHDLWTSEHYEDRVVAARWCAGCPVLDACRQAAETNDERFGVWGGIDRTPAKGRRKAA